MTESERMERRVRLAEAMGWKDIQQNANTPTGTDVCGTWPDNRPGIWGTHRGYIPNFDTDPAAREGLLEWALNLGWTICLSDVSTSLQKLKQCTVLSPDNSIEIYRTDVLHTEAFLSAIDAALRAREKAWIDSTHYEGNYK